MSKKLFERALSNLRNMSDEERAKLVDNAITAAEESRIHNGDGNVKLVFVLESEFDGPDANLIAYDLANLPSGTILSFQEDLSNPKTERFTIQSDCGYYYSTHTFNTVLMKHGLNEKNCKILYIPSYG
jgi:hypothetical protein